MMLVVLILVTSLVQVLNSLEFIHSHGYCHNDIKVPIPSYPSSPVESNRVESNPVKSNPVKSNRVKSNRVKFPP